MKSEPVRVIVVDDRPTFPRYIYRTLTGALELDAPEPREAPKKPRPAAENPPPVEEPPWPIEFWPSCDGRFEVWWIDAKKGADEVLGLLTAAMECCGGLEMYVVVDVRLSEQSKRPALAKRCCEAYFKPPRPADRLFIVSSYFDQYLQVPGHKSPLRVHPKTTATLARIRGEVDPESKAAVTKPDGIPPSDVVHVLVTGAGFELKRREYSRALRLFHYGLPSTATLIKEMVAYINAGDPEALDDEPLELLECDGDGFDHPRCVSPESLKKALAAAAQSRNLDVYWDLVFTNIHKRLSTEPSEDGVRYETASRLEGVELRYRHGFRHAILQHDVGDLEQAIWAAEINGDAWLTTNYTGFADRAIALTRGHGADTMRQWSTVSNEVEAGVLQRPAVLPQPGARPLQTPRRTALQQRRVLIKLHGDIGQVHTMAIAGYDKQPQSPLFVRPGLHVMYSAATELLTQEAQSDAGRPYWWHIIGHSMWADALTETIRRVVTRSACEHVFVIVNPEPKRAVDKLTERLWDAKTQAVLRKVMIRDKSMDAQAYLARLRRVGLPTAGIQPDVWLNAL